jgi:hypothetical protein
METHASLVHRGKKMCVGQCIVIHKENKKYVEGTLFILWIKSDSRCFVLCALLTGFLSL